ncbi:uncharacterized protein LOC124270578 [Haliotis rubra]|uniref:uncharacterized protein LOC124270578 n=1 Tax=Haliotis rubra TaxID=36100 RepID=UPI001EE50F02|nr:uncharacterized protein LOC124270578 [Haliotis rubra]
MFMMLPPEDASIPVGAAGQCAIAIVGSSCVVLLLMYCVWIRGLKLPRWVSKRRTRYKTPVARYHSDYGVEFDLDDAYAYASVDDQDLRNEPTSSQERTSSYDQIGGASGIYEDTSLRLQPNASLNTSLEGTDYSYNHLNHKPKPRVLNHQYDLVIPQGLEAAPPSTPTGSQHHVLGPPVVQTLVKNDYDVARTSSVVYSVASDPSSPIQPSEADVKDDSSDEEARNSDTDENQCINNVRVSLDVGGEISQCRDESEPVYALGTVMARPDSTSQIYDIPMLPVSKIGASEQKEKAVLQKCLSYPETVAETQNVQQVYSVATGIEPVCETNANTNNREIREKQEPKPAKVKPPIKKRLKVKTPSRSVQALATFYDTQLDACSLVKKPRSPSSDLISE